MKSLLDQHLLHDDPIEHENSVNRFCTNEDNHFVQQASSKTATKMLDAAQVSNLSLKIKLVMLVLLWC